MRQGDWLLFRSHARTILVIIGAAIWASCLACASKQKPKDSWDVCAEFCEARHEVIIGVVLGDQKQIMACGCRDTKPPEAM
jgi:hypothetical protein